MGGCYMIGLTQQIRKTIRKSPGDQVDVAVEKSVEERTVHTPEDFRAALDQEPGASGG